MFKLLEFSLKLRRKLLGFVNAFRLFNSKMLRELIPPDLSREQSPDDWKRVSYKRLQCFCRYVEHFLFFAVVVTAAISIA